MPVSIPTQPQPQPAQPQPQQPRPASPPPAPQFHQSLTGGYQAHYEAEAQRQLGYVPTFGEDPRAVSQAYQLIKTHQPLPDWLQGQEKQVEQAFKYHQQRNGNRPYTEWKYLPPEDGGREYLSPLLKAPERKVPDAPSIGTVQDALNGTVNWSEVDSKQRQQVLSDPNFYSTGQIMKYPKWMQSQLLADPSFDWKQLPKWQKSYFELSSSPAGMAAAQGGLLGLGGGPVGGVIGAGLGAGLGYAAAKSGYDPLKEAWQQKGVSASAFGWLNFLAETAEKGIGLGVQAVGAIADDDPTTRPTDVFSKEAWDAGAVTFESITPALGEALKIDYQDLRGTDALRLIPAVFVAERLFDLAANPEKYKGQELILGASDPIDLQQTFQERITEARERISKGEPYRQVMQDFQNGVIGQIGDMAGQAIADPLNVLPSAQVRGAKLIADTTGAKVASQALTNAGGLMEAGRNYKTLVQTGQAMTIDPNFKVDRMGALSRFVAGLNDRGEIRAGPLSKRGLLDAPGTKKTGFMEEMTSLTPQSRAQIGANMFYENIGALLNRFDDPHEAGKYLKALSNSDMETWKELGSRFAESPEFYTVLPALKDYNAQGLDGIIQAWDTSQPNRDALLRISDVLGTEPAKLLDDLAAKGTADQDFQRIAQRLGQSEAPEAQALLAEIQAGTLTPDSLKQMVDAFTGDGAMPWHPGQAKAMMLDSLGSHFDEWVSTRLMLDKTPEAKSAFFRTAALMKQAQSILLLGASPGYAITNGLSNMVHRAASGLFGYLTPKQINGWMDRFGVSPARFDEGVGIGGMIDQATQKTGVKTEVQQKAVRGTGHLADAKDKLAKLSRGMPFSKLSSWFEKNEGRQAFSIAMRQFWSQSWRRGVGFQKMDTNLTRSLQSLGVDPGVIYSAIEAGMNQKEIENILSGRFEGIQTRSLINDAAQRTGITAQQAADLLEKTGVLDALDSQLKGKTTRDGVSSAFRRADKIAQDYMDMRAGEDLKAIAEHARQKVGLEGAVSGLDVVQRVNGTYFDAWLDHYFRLGEVMEDLSTLDDPALRSKAIELQYQQSDAEFRRINARTAANYQGIFEAWGQSDNPRAMEILAAVSQSDQAMKAAYDFMRAERRQFFQEGRPIEEWNASQALIDTQFEVAFKHKHNAEVRMGEALGTLYDELHGPAAGEAARKWWKDVTAFNDDIVKREKKARSEFAQLPKQQREAAKQKYYREAKVMLIAEAEKINQQGVTRLERIIKKGGGRGQGGTPLPKAPDDPTRPGGPADEVDAMLREAETRKAEEARAKAERKAAVWDVAEEFARVGLPFNREIFQDQGSLIAALRNEEHGGFPDLQRLDDERLTPENVRSILEERAAVKEAETAAKVQDAAATIPAPKITDNTSILTAIKEHGGLQSDLAADLTGDTPRRTPGVFRKKGIQMDEMARMLADDGYPIDVNDPSDPGGIQQATILLNRARSGDKVYPIGHDFEAAIRRQEEAYAMVQAEEAKFDQATWQRELDQAIEAGDLTAMYEKIGELPEALEGKAPTGESWSDYLSRMADETALRVTQRNIDEAIADQRARIEADTQAGVNRGDMKMTKRLLEEKFRDVFGLTDEQANAYMELSEAIAGWYTRATGESGDGFYSRYYEDVVNTDGGDLLQEGRIEPINRRMSQPETENYARALVRAGADELRRAVQGEKERGDRIALLNEAHKLNPAIAESVAKESISILFQNAYHGTPYKFDKFTLDAIGSGEGAQVYGWGLYFAGDKSIAEWYRQKLTDIKPQRLEIDGEDVLGGWGETERQSASNRLEQAQVRLAYALEELGVPRDDVNDMVRRLDYQEIEQHAGKRRDLPGTIEDVRELEQEYKDIIRQQRGYLEFYAKTQEWNASKMDSDGIMRRVRTDLENLREGLQRQQERGDGDVYDQQYRKSRIESVDAALEFMDRHDTKVLPRREGQLYEVDIPDENYLLWDRPLQEQPDSVLKALGDRYVKAAEALREWEAGGGTENNATWKERSSKLQATLKELSITPGMTGKEIYRQVSSSPKNASQYLNSIGINGIQYLDGSSRSAGEGSYNYVIFDDNAIQIKETYYQATEGAIAKGAVEFGPDNIKATIHAFESADMTTLVHENAHVFRRVLADVASRTDSKRIKADLTTIEEWAGVKDGSWTRESEEKFARGFEQYLAEGKAPTPALKRAFESFRNWMLSVYKQITGSDIDAKITDEVRQVFDRMLAENPEPEILYQKKRKVDPNQMGMFGAEDLPLFSGTAQTARAEAFTPQAASRQEAMFDMRPQMKGAETKIPTETPEFKRWFGDSKVVDENGKPKAMYHGGKFIDFNSFDPAKDSGENLYGKGFYFTESPGIASSYASKGIEYNWAPDKSKTERLLMERIREAAQKDPNINAEGFRYYAENHWKYGPQVWEEAGVDVSDLIDYKGSQPGVMPVYVSLENPLDLRSHEGVKEFSKKALKLLKDPDFITQWANEADAGITPEAREAMVSYFSRPDLIPAKPAHIDRWIASATNQKTSILSDFARMLGYDGIIHEGGHLIGDENHMVAIAFDPKQIKSTSNRGTYSPTDPNILFQEATQPTGSLDAASQFTPQSEAIDQGHAQFIRPLLAAMEETAINQLDTKPMEALQGADDATQAQLRRYVKQVQNDMATSKLATVRYGEQQRDFAMLNYGKTYGIDRMAMAIFPYEFYSTRSMFTWAARALDKPALFSNYARLKMQQQRYERDIPERLRGKIKIPAPFLPDWMGDGLYIDPLRNLFFPAGVLDYFDRKQSEVTQQELEAERILQEWAADGSITDADIRQAMNREGPAWERALAEGQIRREAEVASPIDFFSTMMGPAWYLSAPLNAAGVKVPWISKGDPNKISTLPITNTARAIDTVTQGSWAEPIGDLIGLIGRPEEWIRKKAGLPTYGEYGEYYQKRQVANMVAEGLITSEDAQIAMVEKQGEIWNQAGERVKMELAVRVPGAAALYAGLHEGPKGLAQAALPSLFGAGLLPAGELEYRGLKGEWNEAWKKADAGDKEAINAFFDEHPEYQAYLAKGKDDGELMKSFMVGQIWDGYMALGATNQKQARKEMGDLFSQAFLDKETRSYESIDTDTLIQWAQMLNKRTPQAVNTQPLNTPPAPEMNLYNEDVTGVTDEYFRQRKENHGNYYGLEQGYYSLPKSQRGSFLLANPELKEYWDFKKQWEKTYPDLVPIFKGQVFKEVNTTNWPPGLLDYVTTYAYTGAPLKKGAYKALEQQWIMEGRPYEDVDIWLNSQVVPALMYSGQ